MADKLEDYRFFSGGAKGADLYWENSLRFNLVSPSIIVYRPEHVDYLKCHARAQYEILNRNYMEVVNVLKRCILPDDTFAGKLVRRDMLQVENADAVFAIAQIDSNGYLKGGTGYASTRAILMGTPVYAFDDSRNMWFKWNNEHQKFIEYGEVPLLTKRACCVGTRELSDLGKQNIDSCIQLLKQHLNI